MARSCVLIRPLKPVTASSITGRLAAFLYGAAPARRDGGKADTTYTISGEPARLRELPTTGVRGFRRLSALDRFRFRSILGPGSAQRLHQHQIAFMALVRKQLVPRVRRQGKRHRKRPGPRLRVVDEDLVVDLLLRHTSEPFDQPQRLGMARTVAIPARRWSCS